MVTRDARKLLGTAVGSLGKNRGSKLGSETCLLCCGCGGNSQGSDTCTTTSSSSSTGSNNKC
jgi:hypothetical protein